MDANEVILSRLEEMEKEIRHKVDDFVLKTEEDVGGDELDRAARYRDQEISVAFSNRDREKLEKIAAAKARVSEGRYGYCGVCEEEIPPARLTALPLAVLCVECKEVKEKEEKDFKG